MNKFQRQVLKDRLLKLARLKSTGTPSDLAFRFEISTRSVKRMVKELRDEGNNIYYRPSARSYVTENLFLILFCINYQIIIFLAPELFNIVLES